MGALTIVLVGCATSSASFYKSPTTVETTSLCRAYFKTVEAKFKVDTGAELARRGIDWPQCQQLIQQENEAIAVGVAAGTAVAAVAAVCASGRNCSGGGGAPYVQTDWDEFYNQYGQLIWACRDIASGQFSDFQNCQGKPQTDLRWPAKYAM